MLTWSRKSTVEVMGKRQSFYIVIRQLSLKIVFYIYITSAQRNIYISSYLFFTFLAGGQQTTVTSGVWPWTRVCGIAWEHSGPHGPSWTWMRSRWVNAAEAPERDSCRSDNLFIRFMIMPIDGCLIANSLCPHHNFVVMNHQRENKRQDLRNHTVLWSLWCIIW